MKFDITTRLAQTEIDHILIGEVPWKWSSDRHFSNEKRYKGPLDIRCICGPWYRHGHFVTFVLCPEYWTFLDPLSDESVIETILHENVKNAFKQSYELNGMEVPNIPTYKQFKRFCIQKDFPLDNWSCGTIYILTTLHLVLGCKRPHETMLWKPKSITRKHILNLHKALLKCLLHGTPPDLWSICCFNRSIVDCDPIPLKHNNILRGPWWASLLKT